MTLEQYIEENLACGHPVIFVPDRMSQDEFSAGIDSRHIKKTFKYGRLSEHKHQALSKETVHG